MPSPLSTRKCLTLSMRRFEKWVLPGIASLFHSSPELEKLVIKFCYGNSLQVCFLRTIEIFCLKEYMFGNKHELALVEFLLMMQVY